MISINKTCIYKYIYTYIFLLLDTYKNIYNINKIEFYNHQKDFQELEENVEYIEKENEFDIVNIKYYKSI